MERYRSTEVDGIFLTELPPILEPRESSRLENCVSHWARQKSKVHVLNFSFVQVFSSSNYRAFVLYNQELKASGRVLYCLGISDSLQKQLKQHGLMSVFVMLKSLDEAKKQVKRDERRLIDAEFITIFLSAAKYIVEVQGRTPVKAGKPFLQKANAPVATDVASVIAFNFKEYCGTISICISRSVFLKVYQNMIGENHEKLDQVILNAVGEMLSSIYGQAKTVLHTKYGYDLKQGSQIQSEENNWETSQHPSSINVILPFESSVGAFHLVLTIRAALTSSDIDRRPLPMT
jgi:CheY-specific phosphatase CheX/anti-anti-sigma regulatory factor